MYTRLGRISWVIGRWKSDKQARDVRGSSYESFKYLFLILLDETIVNTYFLAPFLFRATNPLFGNIRKYEQFKNN